MTVATRRFTNSPEQELFNMFNSSRIFASVSLLASVGCAAPGTAPHDMSAAQHEAMAKQEDTAAAEHAAQHDPSAVKKTEHCPRGQSTPCWSSTVNPTQKHRSEAESHKEMAAKHRAAAGALAQAEATACTGIDPENRDVSPFYHREDVVSVTPFERTMNQGKQTRSVAAGATIKFRAVPALTAEWLQHEVDCHLARAAAVGFDMPEMSQCPLMLKGVKATVSSAGDGFFVQVTSDDSDTAQEILRRAQGLVAAK
jgi:hypothetical protein